MVCTIPATLPKSTPGSRSRYFVACLNLPGFHGYDLMWAFGEIAPMSPLCNASFSFPLLHSPRWDWLQLSCLSTVFAWGAAICYFVYSWFSAEFFFYLFCLCDRSREIYKLLQRKGQFSFSTPKRHLEQHDCLIERSRLITTVVSVKEIIFRTITRIYRMFHVTFDKALKQNWLILRG